MVDILRNGLPKFRYAILVSYDVAKQLDWDGLTVFSSQASQIGADKSNNLGFLASARNGKPASKLVHKGEFSAFDGGVFDRDRVESYRPIRRGDGRIEGVFELYSDVTPLMAKIERFTPRLAAGLLLGAVIGAGAVYLAVPALAPAPAPGSRVKRRFRDLRDDARGHIDDWRDEARRSLARQRRRLRRRRRKRE